MKTKVLSLGASEIERYMTAVKRHPLLSREEELELAYRWANDHDVSAVHKLVASNLRFVVKIANKYRGYGLDLIDLIQEGNIGLMRAAEKFNPSQGYKLITYAVWWIHSRIRGFIMANWSLVKIGAGRDRRKLFFRLRSEKSAVDQLDPELCDDDKIKRLAEELGIKEELVSDMSIRMAYRDYSLDVQIKNNSDLCHIDVLESDYTEDDPERNIVKKENLCTLEEALAKIKDSLNKKELFVLEHRILSDEPPILKEIGRQLGVTRERVRQIEVEVIGKLRQVYSELDQELNDEPVFV